MEDELPLVRVGSCGCVLPADAAPIGYRFVPTTTGDKRLLVYCCAEHDRRTPSPTAFEPPKSTQGRSSRKRKPVTTRSAKAAQVP